MVESYGFYKCKFCGNLVYVLDAKQPPIACCGHDMEILKEFSKADESDVAKEKHVPVVEIVGNTVTVKVGDVPHPMEEAHFISTVQLVKNGKIIAEKKFFEGDEPICTFEVAEPVGIYARALCNLHGLWKSE